MRSDERRGAGISGFVTGWVVSACLISAAVAGPPDDGRTPEVLRAEAVAAIEAGDRATAVERLTEVAKGAPDPAIWRLVGDMHHHLERPDLAVEAWDAALALAPRDTALLDRVARVSSRRGDWIRAADAQRRLVTALAEQAAAGPEVERLDLATGRLEAVAVSHRRHLAALADLAALAGDFTTSEEAARALIASEPKAVDGHLALGYMHLHAGEFRAAADAYTEALRIEPEHPTALNNLGTVYYMDRDLKAAGAQFEAVLGSLARTPYAESVALANLGELYQLDARTSEAEYLYLQAIEAFPAGAWSYMGLAALLDLTGRYDEAVDRMIDGWERDGNRATRLNMHFFQPEWAWQRDALIAEIEGDLDRAWRLWLRVHRGEVDALRSSAAHHLASLKLLLRD